MKKLSDKQIREIRILDLKEAFEVIVRSSNECIWFRELTSIDNAIKYLEALK